VTDAESVHATVERLARELEEGAAVLDAAGDDVWPQRLRVELVRLADLEAIDLDHLLDSIDAALKAMQALGLHAEAHKLAWSAVDALAIGKNLAG